MLGFLPIEKFDKISCLHFLCLSSILAARGFCNVSSCCSTPLGGGWVVGELWCYQNLTDRDQEARLQHQIAVLLVKCLTGCDIKDMQKGQVSPVESMGFTELREKPSSFSSEGKLP